MAAAIQALTLRSNNAISGHLSGLSNVTYCMFKPKWDISQASAGPAAGPNKMNIALVGWCFFPTIGLLHIITL